MTVRLAQVRDRLRALVLRDGSPQRIALALAVGVFISCTPFYGLQTVLSLAVATACRLNKVATVTGTWLNLPWFAPIVYGTALWIGDALWPGPAGPRAKAVVVLLRDASSLTWTNLLDLLRGASVALLIGTTVLGAAAAVATYLVAFALLRRSWPDGRGRAL